MRLLGLPTRTSIEAERPAVFGAPSIKCILEEQAVALKKQTKGLLYGDVRTTCLPKKTHQLSERVNKVVRGLLGMMRSTTSYYEKPLE
jgi:hypothetical protein